MAEQITMMDGRCKWICLLYHWSHRNLIIIRIIYRHLVSLEMNNFIPLLSVISRLCLSDDEIFFVTKTQLTHTRISRQSTHEKFSFCLIDFKLLPTSLVMSLGFWSTIEKPTTRTTALGIFVDIVATWLFEIGYLEYDFVRGE